MSLSSQFASGRTMWNLGGPLQNPNAGPVFRQALHPVRAAGITLPPRGRIRSNPGGPVQNPVPPVAVPPANQAIRAKVPPFSKGRARSNAGAPVRNPGTGPAFRQATTPVRVRITLPPRGRAGFNKGGPVPAPPVTVAPFRPAAPVRARLPLPRRGTCRTVKFYLLSPLNPGGGPVFRQATHPVRAAGITLPPRGRTGSNPGGPVQNPGPPAPQPTGCSVLDEAGNAILDEAGNPILSEGCSPANGQPGPVRARIPGAFLKGRVRSNPGGPLKNPPVPPNTAVFRPAATAVRIHPSQPPRGICLTVILYAIPPAVQAQPPFRSATSPARIRITLPPRGRIGSNPGGPVKNLVPPAPCPILDEAGNPILDEAGNPLLSEGCSPVSSGQPGPVRAKIRQNAPRGRVYSGPGALVRDPHAGPVFRQAVTPARIRVTRPPRGRIASSPGGPVQNPTPDITGLFNIVFPCARLNAPLTVTLPVFAVSLSATIYPGEIGFFAVTLPRPATSLSGTVLHQPLNLIIPVPVTSLSGTVNYALFAIILPKPSVPLTGARGVSGTFAIIFNICSGNNMMRYGALITRRPLKAEFTEPVDYTAGSPYTAWAVSDPQVQWIAG